MNYSSIKIKFQEQKLHANQKFLVSKTILIYQLSESQIGEFVWWVYDSQG